MNNLDPFNLRSNSSPSPLSPFRSILQQGVSLSQQVASQGREAYTHSKQALQQTVSELNGSTPRERKARSSDDEPDRAAVDVADMSSFAVPRNVPNFQDAERRGNEDQGWGTGARNRVGAAVFGNGDKKGLPMYKDKPYNYAASGRRGQWWRSRRTLVLLGAAVLGWVWWNGILFSGPGRPEKADDKSHSGWPSGSGTMKGGKADWQARREMVKDAFKLSWKAYEQHAWGYDEYWPISKKGKQMVPPNGLGWIIVDSLDTMMLMNLTEELGHAREWISKSLDYNADHDVNTFETTIRMLGGLLSAHYLSTEFPDMAPVPDALAGSKGEDLYLEKATDLADRLLGAYESPSGIPWASVNLKTQKGIRSNFDEGASSTAEAATLQLEMKYLAKLTGETQYWTKAEKVMQVIDDNAPQDGLVPIFIFADKGIFRGNNIRLGSRGDSYYEYLIKQYLQTNKQEEIYREMWDETLVGVRKNLLTYSSPNNFLVLGERPNGLDNGLEPKMDHLVCFMPGTIALAVTGGATLAEAKKTNNKWTSKQEEEMQIARELMKTCIGMYKTTATGLAPEIAHFHLHNPTLMYEDYAHASQSEPKSPSNNDFAAHTADGKWKYEADYMIKPADTHNLQRPETVESLFYMWRITGDEIYRQWGWEMFESFLNYTTVPDEGGFSSIKDVTNADNPGWRDNMESFWLAETLKYLYLLFSPADFLPLDKVVFNTEAHPLPRFDMGKLFKTGWTRRGYKASSAVAAPSPNPPAEATAVAQAAGEKQTPLAKEDLLGSKAAEAVDATVEKGKSARDDVIEEVKKAKDAAAAEVKAAVDPMEADSIAAKQAELDISELTEKANAAKAGKMIDTKAPEKEV